MRRTVCVAVILLACFLHACSLNQEEVAAAAREKVTNFYSDNKDTIQCAISEIEKLFFIPKLTNRTCRLTLNDDGSIHEIRRISGSSHVEPSFLNDEIAAAMKDGTITEIIVHRGRLNTVELVFHSTDLEAYGIVYISSGRIEDYYKFYDLIDYLNIGEDVYYYFWQSD